MVRVLAIGISAALIGAAAYASAPVMPVRGTIDSINGSTVQLTEDSGAKATLTLAPGASVTEVLPSSLADVKPGSYIGTAAVKQRSGEYRAMELQIFPASMRGIGLGTRAWNLAPHSTMTNGTVGGLAQEGGKVGSVSGSGDLTLTVNDGHGTKTVLIPSSVPVVTYAPGSMADLKPGAHVILFPTENDGSKLTASRIAVGANGLTPPM